MKDACWQYMCLFSNIEAKVKLKNYICYFLFKFYGFE